MRTDRTCYVIAYDISDDRRRKRVHQVLSGFGTWTQFSLFECFLTGSEHARLERKLRKRINIEQGDRVRIYTLCANCVNKIETIGGTPPQEEVVLIV